MRVMTKVANKAFGLVIATLRAKSHWRAISDLFWTNPT